MNNATPEKTRSLPTNTEERLSYLSDFNDDLLKDVYLFLNQLKRAGVGKYLTAEYEIKGLSNLDTISWALSCINPLYRDIEGTQAENEYIENNPVFYLAGFTNGSENYAERTFATGPQFENALREIGEVLNKKNRYLIFEKDEFIYNGNKLSIEPDSYGYIILKYIYTILNGKSGEISYEDLIRELTKEKKFKNLNNYDIQEKIRRYVTSHTDGLGLKIGLHEKNGKPLIDTKYGYGIIFNNN